MPVSSLLRAVVCAAVTLSLSVSAAPKIRDDKRPVAQVYPYEAKRLPDGRVQLSYDLSGVKSGLLDTDAASELDEPSLKELAKKLPNEAKVIIEAPGGVHVKIATDREKAAPAPSFAQVATGEFAAETPLDRGPGARLLPALHPDSPKLLLSTELVLWKVRHANESIVAGLLLAADDGALGLPLGGKALWQGLLKAALERAKQNEGFQKEGALVLAEQLAAALKRQGAALPPGVSSNETLNAAVEARADKWEDAASTQATTLRSTFTPELRKLEQRDRALSEPLTDSRAGKAAALTLLAILEKDAKLKAGYDGYQKLRASLFGAPANDVLAKWSALAQEQGGPSAAFDDFAAFVSALQERELPMPPLFAWSDAPIERALNELGGASQENARDDVVLQLEENRLQPDASENAPWLSAVDHALAASVLPPEPNEKPVRTRSRGQRARVASALIASLPAPSWPADSDGEVSEKEDRRPYGLQISLEVPPQFFAEPTTAFYRRLAFAYARLEKFLAATGKAGTVSGVLPGGAKRSANNKGEAQKLKRLFRGLELISSAQAPSTPEDKESLKVSDQFIAQWKSDQDLAADIRFAAPVRGGARMAVYGVGRQAVRYSWDSPPKVTIVGGGEALVADLSAAQRYFVPELVNGELTYAGTLPDRATFRQLSDLMKRDPAAVDASMSPGN